MAWFVMVALLSIGIDFEYSNLDPHEQTAKKMSGLQYISYDCGVFISNGHNV